MLRYLAPSIAEAVNYNFLFTAKMKLNLLTKCILKSPVRNSLLVREMCRVVSETEQGTTSTKCNCQAVLTCNITSNVLSRKRLNEINNCRNVDVHRRLFYSTNDGPPSTKLPPLMNFPEIVWPSIIKSFRNFILSTFIIKPYFDREFNLPDFVSGSKKALQVVSTKIAAGDIKSLDGLVTSDVIFSLQKSTSYMSVFQREQIAINIQDIYFSFPYQVQVGIMFSDEEGKEQKRFVEITMVYHALKGLNSMRERGEEPPLNLGLLPEYQKRISICNYRFIREFTKGKESDWTINLLNHFKPSDSLVE